MHEPIFTVSGLRGIVGQSFTPELVFNYAFQFSRFVTAKTIAVGRDTRCSGPMFMHSVYTGLLFNNCTIFDFGVCPTPAIVMMVKKNNLDGGIQITASHNPENWNGLKFISRHGRFFYDAEITKFKSVLKKQASFNCLNRIQPKLFKFNIIDEYVHNIISSKYFKNIPNRRFKVGIDSCNGAAEEAAVRLVKLLGGIPYSINKAAIGFPRAPEPQSENLKMLSSLVRKEKLDFGIAFDPDGDRFACVDEQGVPLSEESSVLLALLFVLKNNKSAVVVNNSTTTAIDDLCRQYRVPLYRSKTGEANVVKKMEQVNALIGGEGNGGVIFPSINNTRDGLVATAMLVKLLARERQPLSLVRKSIPQYFMLKTAFKKYRQDWHRILPKYFKTHYSVKFDFLDGVKVIGENFWMLIRPSNTEPIIRIIAESKSQKFTKQLIKEITEVIRK